jgi:hypothetical protein
MALKVKTAKNSKLPKLPENCFEPVGKGGCPPISIWISIYSKFITLISLPYSLFTIVTLHVFHGIYLLNGCKLILVMNLLQ